MEDLGWICVQLVALIGEIDKTGWRFGTREELRFCRLRKDLAAPSIPRA